MPGLPGTVEPWLLAQPDTAIKPALQKNRSK
jgi:hypothetical protein